MLAEVLGGRVGADAGRDGAAAARVRAGCDTQGGARRADLGPGGADFAVDEAQVTVREGKRRKTRIVPVNSGLAAVCADWLHVRGDDEGFLLWTCVKGGGLIDHSRISDQTVYDVVLSRGAEAGIRRFTPHDMRRTYSGELLDAGVDLATVQKLMGHSSASTTAGYDRRGVQARRKAAEMLHMRWERRFE
ncbi:MAG: site-specific integrase [Caldilineaceae bacterium]